MTRALKAAVTLLLFTLLPIGLAQSIWSGRISGLPDEAAGIGLYVYNFEQPFGDVQGRLGKLNNHKFRSKVASGVLNSDKTFLLEPNVGAVQKVGNDLAPRQVLRLSKLTFGKKVVVTPEDARLSAVAFGIEDTRGEYIGSIVPKEGKSLLRYGYLTLVVAHEPTLVEGSVWDVQDDLRIVYDATISKGLNVLRAGTRLGLLNLLEPRMVIDSVSESPEEWIYRSY